MEEKSRNMTDEHLSRQLHKSKSGKLGGKLLSLVGGVVAIAGIILGGNIVLVVIGGVILGLGQLVQGKSKDKASQQAFDAIQLAHDSFHDLTFVLGMGCINSPSTNIGDIVLGTSYGTVSRAQLKYTA